MRVAIHEEGDKLERKKDCYRLGFALVINFVEVVLGLRWLWGRLFTGLRKELLS